MRRIKGEWMTFIDYVFSGLVAFGTIFLASVTYLSIRESRRKEEKADRLDIYSEKIEKLYIPLVKEIFEARRGNLNINKIYMIAYLNYILAEENTKKSVDTMVSHFSQINPNYSQETQVMIKADYQSLEDAIKTDYDKLIKLFYKEKGVAIPDSFKIPDIRDEVKNKIGN